MSSPFGYQAYKPPTFNQGTATQNQLYQNLSQAPQGSGFGGYNQSGDATPAAATPVPAALGQAQNAANVNSEMTSPAAAPTTSNNGGGGMNLDFSGDPILAQIRAMNAMNVANAESSALAQRQRAEIGYGYDPALKYEDQATQASAQQNPFSVLAQLAFAHQQREGNLTEGLNKANLFYSGERIRQTGLEGRQTLLNQSQAQNSYQNQLEQIAQMVLAAKMQAQQSELSGESSAYDRAIQFALANGLAYPGGGGTQGMNSDFFQQGHVAGYDDNAIWGAAVANAPAGMHPHSVMHNGAVDNGGFWVKYDDPNGGTDTIWVPLPAAPPPTNNTNTNTNTTTSTPPPTTTTPPVTAALVPRPRLVPQ